MVPAVEGRRVECHPEKAMLPDSHHLRVNLNQR
jgi:hypothetical protein